MAALFLGLGLAASFSAVARLGDSVAQTLARYGQPADATGQAGEQTSTKTFNVSGLQVTCGYVDGKVEMETVTRADRNFEPPEVEALLRTNGTKRNDWTTPAGGYVDGTYTRADGVTANLSGNTLAMQSSKWTDALAKDQAAEKAAADQARQQSSGSTNAANPNYTAGSATNAASYEEPGTVTNAVPAGPTTITTTTTNAP